MATDARTSQPLSGIKELTIRGIILGALITVVFTAANVYLGLKIGITFATSIPAAVISMAVLKAFRDATIQENNIVQTIASAAGTLSAIIFVLPGLIMVGWWTGFPYWLSVAVIGIGGILGVMYSVPLRRALVTGTDLPYPEGVAAAEVLKVGVGRRRRRGEQARPRADRRIDDRRGALLPARQDQVADRHRRRRPSTSAPARLGISTSLSMALIGVGHLVGVAVGVAMVDRHADQLGVHRPALDAGRRPIAQAAGDSRRWSARRSGRRRAWSAPAPSASPRSGRCSRSSARSSPAFARRSSPTASARPAAAPSLPLTERDMPIGIVTGTILAVDDPDRPAALRVRQYRADRRQCRR